MADGLGPTGARRVQPGRPADPPGAWRMLASLPSWRVTEVPREVPPGADAGHPGNGKAVPGGADPGIARRAQALAAAYGTGTPVAFGWIREQAFGPVGVIAAGHGLAGQGWTGRPAGAGSARAGEVTLTVPAGARAIPVPDAQPASGQDDGQHGDRARAGEGARPSDRARRADWAADVAVVAGHGPAAADQPRGGAAAAFAALPCWTPVPLIADALLGEDDMQRIPRSASALPPSLEEGLLAAWDGEFGWLVLAEPVDGGGLAAMVSEVARAQLTAQPHDSPRSQLTARRAAARHAELRRAAATGMWRIRLLAGAGTPVAAARVAGLLCASVDLDGLPYALARVSPCGPLPDVIGYPGPPAGPGDGHEDPGPEFPCAGSTRLLAALVRPPDREVPGIRFVLRPEFDVTPEHAATSAPARLTGEGRGERGAGERFGAEDPEVPGTAVSLGTVLDVRRAAAGELTVPRASLNRHVFVCGATGSGKSQTVRHLLESATAAGIPWLVIEPAKAEYRLMAARLGDSAEVVAIRPGDLAVAPAGMNPLEPARYIPSGVRRDAQGPAPGGMQFPLQAHADMLRALFLAAFAAEEPFPQVLAAALTRCYEQAGWDLVTGQPLVRGAVPGYPTLRDLQDTAMAVIEDIGYSREITDNVRGFVAVRIGSLRLGTTGRFLDGGHPLDFGRLLTSNVVLEIEDCGDDADKAFLTGAVLIRLTQYLRLRQQAERAGTGGGARGGLRHLTVVEEAHRLLRQPPPGTGNGPAAHAVEMFAGLLAEVRAYGEGLIIAEQIPAKLIPDVIKNTAVKIVHRLPAKDDRDVVGATMNLTDAQSRYLVTLVPGEAAVFADGMDYPVLARMPDGTARESGDQASRASAPVGLIGVRSAACAPSCAKSPCPLGLIRAAQNLLARDRRLSLWAELCVAGHLAGLPMPVPRDGGLAVDIRGLDPRLRDCALGQAADEAVAARVPVLGDGPGASALAAHVAAVMRAAIDDGAWPCREHEPPWVAPAWRWDWLLAMLEQWEGCYPGGGPHPQTAQWERQLGRVIPGDTCAEQAAAVRRWYQRAQKDAAVIADGAFGRRHPSAIERAVGASAGAADWTRWLADALADFTFDGHEWPRDLLAPPDPVPG